MKLYEHQGLDLFKQYGIAVPHAMVVTTADEAARSVGSPGGRAVIKAQILAGGRGKAGGVKIARSAAEARDAAGALLSMTISGYSVKKLLVEELLDIEQEAYLSVALDRSIPGIGCIACPYGGQDIENIVARNPLSVYKATIDRGSGPDWSACDSMLYVAFGPGLAGQAMPVARSLYRLLIENDGLLAEINPFARTRTGAAVAADAKVIIDDNALWRREGMRALQNKEEHSLDETDARAAGLSFVALDGTIGCIVNGAGLAMATMDTIRLFGGSPANFLDVGGSSNPDKILTALEILLRNPAISVVLINIFGGITRCDDIARGILMARQKLTIQVPLVIRLTGTNEEEARGLLALEGLKTTADMTEAVAEAALLDKKVNRLV